jgi:hypothetical protein
MYRESDADPPPTKTRRTWAVREPSWAVVVACLTVNGCIGGVTSAATDSHLLGLGLGYVLHFICFFVFCVRREWR